METEGLDPRIVIAVLALIAAVLVLKVLGVVSKVLLIVVLLGVAATIYLGYRASTG